MFGHMLIPAQFFRLIYYFLSIFSSSAAIIKSFLLQFPANGRRLIIIGPPIRLPSPQCFTFQAFFYYSQQCQKPAKMALRATMLRTAGVNSSLRRFVHITARPAPLDSVVNRPTAASSSLILPENENSSNMFPNSPFIWGSMELMAVPKKKVSRHKRGIRNGPKALKPVPVIIRCKQRNL